jgi:cytosine/adenosine deaminase-related metal-dependent hydrolase
VRAYQEYLGRFDEGRLPYEADPGKLFSPGLSPHAPYSSDTELFRRCISLARERGIPLSTHGAEIRWEEKYLLSGTGPLYEFLVKLGFAHDEPKPWDSVRPSCLADWLAAENPPGPLQFVHGTWLRKDEYAALQKLGATVVYCPASVAYFHAGRDSHPVEGLLAAGIPVALGTDSLASGHTLNMPETCTLAARAHPALRPATILEMATMAGARSLAFGNCGSLEPGKEADILVFDSQGLRPGSAEESLELAILSGFAVPQLHVIAGEPYAFTELSPLKA